MLPMIRSRVLCLYTAPLWSTLLHHPIFYLNKWTIENVLPPLTMSITGTCPEAKYLYISWALFLIPHRLWFSLPSSGRAESSASSELRALFHKMHEDMQQWVDAKSLKEHQCWVFSYMPRLIHYCLWEIKTVSFPNQGKNSPETLLLLSSDRAFYFSK